VIGALSYYKLELLEFENVRPFSESDGPSEKILAIAAELKENRNPQHVRYKAPPERVSLEPAGTGPFPAVLFNHGSGGADADHTACPLPKQPTPHFLSSMAMRFCTHFAAVMAHLLIKHRSCRTCCVAKRN
jgi:hypothetical protein